MVSFSCENCGDILTKKKLDPHRNQCYGASFTCIDCMVHFQGTDYRSHTSCMTEAQKYQGHLYRGEKKKGKGPQQNQNQNQNQNQSQNQNQNQSQNQNQNQSQNHSQALVPRNATVEDQATAGTVAVVDVPPKAPSPPPASEALPAGVNVFDFLVKDSTKPAAIENGYSYGSGPVQPSLARYSSYGALPAPDNEIKTPAPKREREREEKKSDKKRKRDNVELGAKHTQDQEMSDAPSLHTGLTGGLNRMLSGPDFGSNDEGTPLNPDKKRSKKELSKKSEDKGTTKPSSSRRHEKEEGRSRDSDRSKKHGHRRNSSSSEGNHRTSRNQVKAIDYRGASSEPRANTQVVTYRSPAELFLSFVNKGPESGGLSVSKALKRFHREQEIRGEKEDDKDLWKGLRVRKNEQGEIVLFT